MPTELVTPDIFLARLTQAFEKPDAGAVWLTAKRYTYDGADAAMSGDEDEHDVLLRAAQGEDKFSTRIQPAQLPLFHQTYGALLKAQMGGKMRKRDKKRERARADAQAKRRKELYVDVAVTGAKRGAGRRQRQRKVAAQAKKEKQREEIELREERRKAEARD
ncbi:hypothetical protein A1Q2_06461 [Trichosporon asahii var. asahii CBS 8904]|uniref:Signal recognition particle subunit SRP14 n=1 Tax=Trichosporon asahii var. asahii (strain CBS 8904) TaxID=1220162 RepID=K1VJB5_TRIAC|nr:hypothetical protein A1Q2_06461 [Trichosporon asahii var. asahii CBS 8904]